MNQNKLLQWFQNPQEISISPNNKGISLIEVVVATGIMTILMLTFASMQSRQSSEIRFMQEQMAAMDTERLLAPILGQPSVCTYLIKNPTTLSFNPSQITPGHPQVVQPTLPVYSSVKIGPPLVLGPIVASNGLAPSPYSNSLTINNSNGIRLEITDKPTPLPASGLATFKGKWVISFDNTKLVRALKPIEIVVPLIANITSATHANLSSCNSNSGGSTYQVTNAVCVGTCNFTNNYGQQIFVTAFGGDANSCNGNTNNSYYLAGGVNGTDLVQAIDNNDSRYKNASISFYVPPGKTWHLKSYPYECGGAGGRMWYSIYLP